MRSEPSPIRSRTRGQRTAPGPMPVTISRSGRCPWRTSRWRPSSVSWSAWRLSKAATSASTACESSARAPLRKTSVSGSENVPRWESRKTLLSVTAYHSFGGEVGASNTTTIRRLTPSCRHQLSPIALHGPARILVFLPVFRHALLPRLRRLADLHVVILVAAIALFGNRHDRGVNHLAAARNVALRLQMLAKARNHRPNQPALRKRLSAQPQRRAVRNAVLNAKPQKPRERQPVAHLILDLFLPKSVKRFHQQNTKHHHDVARLAAGAALLLIRRRQNRHRDLSAETLERHHASNHFQRIALRGNRRKPPVRIEESKLPHRPHTRESCCHNSDSHKFAELAIFRGALNAIDQLKQPPIPGEAVSPGHIFVGSRYGRFQLDSEELKRVIAAPTSNTRLFCQWFLVHLTLMLDGRSRINLVSEKALATFSDHHKPAFRCCLEMISSGARSVASSGRHSAHTSSSIPH